MYVYAHTHTHYLTIPVLAVSAIRLSSSAGNSSLLSLMHPVKRPREVGTGGRECILKQYTVEYMGGVL